MSQHRGTLMLIRHGESVANARSLFTGVLDVGLTPSGARDCVLAGARLLGVGFHPDLVLTSHLVRGWRTAELIGEELGYSGPVQRHWQLNERNYGALSGLSKSQVRAEHGQEKFRYWRRSYDGRPPSLPEPTLALWRSLPPFAHLPTRALTPTESLADVVARLRPWWHRSVTPQLAAGRHVLVVAHGNSLRALCGVIDGLGPDELSALNLPNARPLRYQFHREPAAGTSPDAGAAGAESLQPLVRGGQYLDPDAAHQEAQIIAAQGGT